MNKIPFVDLKIQYKSIKPEIDSAIHSVIEDTAFIKGKYVSDFEKSYAREYGVKNCISCANGTDAIYISLKALDIGPGDEVITTACSWISTSETISQTGAKPVFVDIESDYFHIDVSKIHEKITEKTKAIIPVHLYGQPVDLSPLVEICEEYNLHMIEDCAQAHFAEYDGKKVGTFGISGTFSFFPGKNLGAYGDAGCIISNDDDFSERARKFANHGALKKHHHDIEGINSRLDGLQAAILSAKLPYILEWNNKRLANAKFYSSLLDSFEYVKIPKIRNNVKHVFHLYVVLVDNREELQSYLSEKGISTGIHYPSPLPFLSAYKHLKHNDSDFPISSLYQNKILSLPMFPEITKSDMELVVKSIKEFFN